MKKEVYVTDKEYSLVRVTTEQEKSNYMKLRFPENNTSEFYQKEENRELFWRVVQSLSEIDFSIYNAEGEYCGNIELKNYDTPTPEIGIELMEHQRNKGIAGRVIKMLANKYYEEKGSIEHFVLKVSSNNLHSKHMIEKIGAEFAGEEETLEQRALRLMKEKFGEDDYGKLQEESRKDDGIGTVGLDSKRNAKELKEVVYRYRLMPEVFLK